MGFLQSLVLKLDEEWRKGIPGREQNMQRQGSMTCIK
jgi:hypothetical protein